MADTNTLATPQAAFLQYERTVRIHNYRLACLLATIFMPFGVLLDLNVYPERWRSFLMLRLVCSALLFFFRWVIQTPIGQKHLWILGQIVAAIPTLFMSIMVYKTTGFSSPYYAGINLVLLSACLLLRWTLVDSIVVVLTAMGIYFTACIAHGPISTSGFGILFNNLYFIFVTGVFVIIGNLFYNRVRFREFTLRYELDQNRAMLAESNEKLRDLDQVKNRFFANISHELRTPLTLLLSPLETMIHSRTQQFDAPTKNLLVMMQANGMRLLKLINDLLDLVRLESGRMDVKREPLEIGAFISGLVNGAKQMAEMKKINLQMEIAPGLGAVQVDRDKLEKTILNLVFNALKFTPGGGSVTLAVQKTGEQMILTVADTGVGIAPKSLPYVFDRFWQADNSSKRKFQGVGIGLSLVKELTEVQGGTVSVVSEENKGTTFTVSLPFIAAEPGSVPAPVFIPQLTAPGSGAENNNAPAMNGSSGNTAASATNRVTVPEAAPASQSEEWLANLYRRAELFPLNNVAPVAAEKRSADDGRTRLLVADDEPDMLRFLKSQLVEHYDVTEAIDGAQAAEKAVRLVPDIILLDMNMPEKDGLQVCQELRQVAVTRDIPIIILTARADEETKLTALSAGANDFLSKPFSTSELHVRVKNLVEAHHNRKKLARQNQTLEKTIEQLKETESLLVQNEKMASLGRLSAGIMHEINNPLNYATTGLYTLHNKKKLLAPEHQEEYGEVIQEIEDGIARIKGIVTDLKAFSHADHESLVQVELPELIHAALRFLSTEWKDKVHIEQALPETCVILANRNKLLQVFVNIFQNSLDALRRKLPLEKNPTIWISGRAEAEKVFITVRDNGEGMDAATISKVFDPFFTTKDVGEGMGLGLTICYRIVGEFSGRILVQSEKGKYCQFTLEFPSLNSMAAPAIERPQLTIA